MLSVAPGASTQGSSLLQLESLTAAKKRCEGVTKNGTACTAWAIEGGLCYFHANPDKAAELGRNGGRRRKHTYEQSTEHIAPLLLLRQLQLKLCAYARRSNWRFWTTRVFLVTPDVSRS